MILNKQYVFKLLREGRAKVKGYIVINGYYYVTVSRTDIKRTDCYKEAKIKK